MARPGRATPQRRLQPDTSIIHKSRKVNKMVHTEEEQTRYLYRSSGSEIFLLLERKRELITSSCYRSKGA